MARVKMYQVDAFAERPFEGNPAAVVPLAGPAPSAEVMQRLAQENNLSETAFVWPEGEAMRLRWFTPGAEVDLCGHATLATAHILLEQDELRFMTRSGDLIVERSGDTLAMNFPLRRNDKVDPPQGLLDALGVSSNSVHRNVDDYLVELSSEAEVAAVEPNFSLLAKLPVRGVIVTAPGEQFDFVSRFFAPRVGVNEDPVTGSAHCALASFWRDRLEKASLVARQVSPRGGTVHLEVRGERVVLKGKAVTVFEAELSEEISRLLAP